MRTLALTVAYDGTDWAGLQRQSTRPSIQGALETALSGALQETVKVVAAGRTDAGVHALGQVVSLRCANPMPIARVAPVVNQWLPPSIRVRRAEECEARFHARCSAADRRYWYVLQTTRHPDPLRGRFCWQVAQPVDAARMQAALVPLLGRHDFRAFCHGGPPIGSGERTLLAARVRTGASHVIIDVRADAFLHMMVRLLVANLVQIGVGDRPVTWLADLLASRNRHLAGVAAPARGLILMRVGYAPGRASLAGE
jgi:tRNA pseudouridine38-40 synthase